MGVRGRSSRGALAAGFSILAVFAARADEAVLTPDDFAWGRAIEIENAGALQKIELDLDVYRGSAQPQLADLRVFNAAGEGVPFEIRSPRPREAEPAPATPLPFFPLPARSPLEEDAASADRRYRIDAEVSETGAILHLRSEPGADAASGYLVDASALEQPFTGLAFTFAPGGPDFVVPVQVSAGDDLTDFAPLAARGVLARLDHAGHRIESSRIEWSPLRRRYLRIHFGAATGSGSPVAVTAVAALWPAEVTPSLRAQVRIEGRAVSQRPGVFRFDLGGAVPVDRVQVELPAPNSLVEATLASASSEDGSYLRRFSGLLYDLDREPRLRNPEIDWPAAARPRHFELAVSSAGGGLAGGDPALTVSWRPEELVFVARGEAPFRLAYGRAGAPPGRLRAGDLAAIAEAGGEPLVAASARLGPREVLGGPDRLVQRPRGLEPRILLLWAVLVASVATVALLAVRLLRQLG